MARGHIRRDISLDESRDSLDPHWDTWVGEDFRLLVADLMHGAHDGRDIARPARFALVHGPNTFSGVREPAGAVTITGVFEKSNIVSPPAIICP
jgi:hypothetical protein